MFEELPWYVLNASWLSLPVAVLALLAGRWLMVYLGGRRAREQATAALKELGEPTRGLRARDDGTVVTLRGELTMGPVPTFSYSDGKVAAACTMQVSNARTWAEDTALLPSSDRRAERLVLVTPDGDVPLVGDVTVRVGRREHWPAVDIAQLDDEAAKRVIEDATFDPRTFDGFAVFRTLRAGDTVVARGKLVKRLRQGGHGGSYREQAARWELTPGEDPIELAWVKPPRFSTKESIQLAGPGMVVAALVVAHTWFFIDLDPKDGSSECGSVCWHDGRCTPRPELAGFGVGIRCERTDPMPCQHMKICRTDGACTERDGKCVVTRDEDCLAIPDCTKIGRCSLDGDSCEITSDADCRRTDGCASDGYCSMRKLGKKRYCGLGSDRDCAGAVDCKLKGACTFVGGLEDGSCLPGSDEDCANSRYCRDEGLCTHDGENRCIAGSDADCKPSMACTRSGRCFANRGGCQRVQPLP